MAIKRMQYSTWQKLTDESESNIAKLNGDSPGGAAVQLGCSRQAIHGLIKRGRLDAVAVYKGTQLMFYVIPQPSLDRYKVELREAVEKRLGAIA